MATKECELHDVFCENVRARRARLGLTQQEVADRLGISGPAYSQLESGRRCPTLQVVERVAQALNTAASSLIRTGK